MIKKIYTEICKILLNIVFQTSTNQDHLNFSNKLAYLLKIKFISK